MRSDKLLSQENAMLLVVDLQDAFLNHIKNINDVIERSCLMIKAAQLLEIPIVVTEQYPQGLGRTAETIQNVLGETTYYDKLAFGCLADDTINSVVTKNQRQQIIVIGIETHVCISQTVHDLLAHNLLPFIATDAVSSRHKIDHKTALRRMQHAGATITTTEAALFEMMASSKHNVFRDISKLVK